MKSFEEIVVAFFFSIFLLIFLLLTTVNLLLNPKYLLYVFEKHDIYSEISISLSSSLLNDPNLSPEEKKIYSQTLSTIPKSALKKIIDTNILNIINFINGKNTTIVIEISAKDIGIGSTNVKWSSSYNNSFVPLYNKGILIFQIWLLFIIFLAGLLYLFFKLTKKIHKLLIIESIPVIILGFLIVFLLPQIVKTFPKNLEPSQAMIGILLRSVVFEVGLIWFLIGLVILGLGILFKKLGK